MFRKGIHKINQTVSAPVNFLYETAKSSWQRALGNKAFSAISAHSNSIERLGLWLPDEDPDSEPFFTILTWGFKIGFYSIAGVFFLLGKLIDYLVDLIGDWDGFSFSEHGFFSYLMTNIIAGIPASLVGTLTVCLTLTAMVVSWVAALVVDIAIAPIVALINTAAALISDLLRVAIVLPSASLVFTIGAGIYSLGAKLWEWIKPQPNALNNPVSVIDQSAQGVAAVSQASSNEHNVNPSKGFVPIVEYLDVNEIVQSGLNNSQTAVTSYQIILNSAPNFVLPQNETKSDIDPRLSIASTKTKEESESISTIPSGASVKFGI